jgi:hypothetical protein
MENPLLDPDPTAAPEGAEQVAAPEGAEQVAAPEGAEQVTASLHRIEAGLAAVRATLAETSERAAARERVIDRLHEENQRLRVGERQLLLRPVLVDLCRLRDGLLRQAATLPASVAAAEMSKLLESFAYSVEQALDRCGVRPLGSSRGDAVDPGQHRVVDTVAAAEPDQDGRVADVLADGYLDTVDNRVLAPTAVRACRWTPPTSPASDRQMRPDPTPGTGDHPA